jgi:hypothetical protein
MEMIRDAYVDPSLVDRLPPMGSDEAAAPPSDLRKGAISRGPEEVRRIGRRALVEHAGQQGGVEGVAEDLQC